jgi:hypothetical protein
MHMKLYHIPVNPINVNAVKRCARSAHTRPLTNTLSNVLTFSSLALAAAALSLATFCCGVSPGGPGCDRADIWPLGEETGGRAVACGVVEVKRVASAADLAMMDVESSSISLRGMGWVYYCAALGQY